jgi:hypothetical protein
MAAERAEVTPELAREAGDLRVCMSRLARRLRREDRGHALTMSQLTTLSRPDRLGATTQSELAAAERVRPQPMARTLDALEAPGPVGRTTEEEYPPASGRPSATGADSFGSAGSGGVWMGV